MCAQKNVFNAVRFSSHYQVAGDFDWILTCIERKMRFFYLNEIIADYNIDGISGSNVARLHSELKSIIRNHYPGPLRLLYPIFLDISYLKYKFNRLFQHE